MADAKVCRQHLAVKKNGYCLRCKSEAEKRRYDADPQKQRDRKQKAYYAKKSLQRKLEAINGDIMAQTCEHDGALMVPEEEMKVSYDDTVFFCQDCGSFFLAAGQVIPDPTEGEPAAVAVFPQTTEIDAVGTQTTQTRTTRSKKGTEAIHSQRSDNGQGSMQLGTTPDVGRPPLPDASVRGSLQDVSAGSKGKELLPDAAQTADSKSGAKRTTKALPGSDSSLAAVLPGPWIGAPCPNLSAFGCKGLLEPFHTLKSEQFGNTFMYRCPIDGVQVVLDFKRATAEHRQ